MMDKTKLRAKRKARSRPTFDFVSWYSLLECVNLLKQQNGQVAGELGVLSPFRPPEYELAVEMRRVNQVSYDFCLQWKLKKYRWRPFPSKHPYVLAKGCIKQQDSPTRIVGQIKVVDVNGIVFTVWSLSLVFLFYQVQFMVEI
ncbi:MAG TPA: hypothetical protein VHO69_15830 [Phototrophicaceae bacterium]|nr:hypothetical protein [Phototrophicaceae bacterium]